MNIDFSARPGFSAYVLLLMVTGIAMMGLASPLMPGLRRGSRILNAAFGLGFFCYGFYLAFLFHGGHYIIFFKAFVLPVLLVLRSIGTARRNRRQAAQQSGAQAPYFAGQPSNFAPQAPYYQPPAPAPAPSRMSDEPAVWGPPPPRTEQA